ncbi:substrate-binding domain-containing protein [Yinghuangia sp. KLBMP8922]|uniref:Substrate-binding domain-containing protein n=1 Tax=Yinghuangia soli TaxID=2908204 RepID=A0AA41U1S1_9ACTN|nr:substrate-binding domain-containing protein [Yinghuangia soli]MCF2531028.1 substrate-binding domain-containing protein [Yinghuangia soli]
MTGQEAHTAPHGPRPAAGGGAVPIRGLSSMATRQILAELADEFGRSHDGIALHFESAGGVAVARQVREGAEADVLVLADDAMAALAGEGLLATGTVRPLWTSPVVAAVPSGAPVPPFATESDLPAALLGAARIAYSTGPSGTALLELIDRLGLADALRDRLVQAPPGVPAGSLLSAGEADLALQQHSELMDLPGVFVIGPLPGDTAIESTFTGGVLTSSAHPQLAREVLDFLASDAALKVAGTRGMSAAKAED